jgi:hypothetical protein
MRHIALAAMQLLFFWVFIILYIFTMVPLAVVVAMIPTVGKREKK